MIRDIHHQKAWESPSCFLVINLSKHTVFLLFLFYLYRFRPLCLTLESRNLVPLLSQAPLRLRPSAAATDEGWLWSAASDGLRLRTLQGNRWRQVHWHLRCNQNELKKDMKTRLKCRKVEQSMANDENIFHTLEIQELVWVFSVGGSIEFHNLLSSHSTTYSKSLKTWEVYGDVLWPCTQYV